MMIWGGLTCLSACLVKPTLVSIAPDHGYVDGCIDVTIQGHNLGSSATGDVGDAPLTNVTPAEKDPNKPDWAQDVGFLYHAQVPPAPGGKNGFYDLHLKVDGANLTLPFGFYYRDCPASFVVDSVSLPNSTPVSTTYGGSTLSSTTGVAVGDQIGLVGCGLDPTNVTAEYHLVTVNAPTARVAATDTAATTGPGTTDTSTTTGAGTTDTAAGTTPTGTTTTVAPDAAAIGQLAADCSTARAHTVVPAGLAAGTYEVWLRHSDNTLYSSVECTARAGSALATPYTTPYYSSVLTWTGDSAAACAPIVVTVGGAR